MIEILKQLSDAGGISGFEFVLAPKVEELLRPYCDEVTRDQCGNVIGWVHCGETDAPTVMIESHMDGIGLMVKNITDRGFLTFVPIGGIDPRILPASEVVVYGKKELFGVIGAKPPHLQSQEDAKKAPKISDMAIDVGMSAEEVKQIVSVGDMVYFKAEAVSLPCGKGFSGKYLDDRAGIVSLLICLERLKGHKLPFHLAVLCAVQEEVGLRGAKMGAHSIFPSAALVVDVCHGNTPDSGAESVFAPGSGTVLSLGPNIHPKMAEIAKRAAEEKGIQFSLDVDGGNTGTDAWAVQVARTGIATLLLSIPLRYMHTTVETLSFDDVTATGDLLAETLIHLNGEEFSSCI
jgi:putative aminopeptidase FrvX